jgi:hypothetical protein
MATTIYTWRIVLIVPVAQVAAVGAWFAANISPNAVPANVGPPLNPSGLAGDPVTHRWCNGGWTESEARAIIVKAANLAGVAVPSAATWAGWNRSEKIAWLRSVQANLWANAGIWLALTQNEGGADFAADELAGRGLKVAS